MLAQCVNFLPCYYVAHVVLLNFHHAARQHPISSHNFITFNNIPNIVRYFYENPHVVTCTSMAEVAKPLGKLVTLSETVAS